MADLIYTEKKFSSEFPMGYVEESGVLKSAAKIKDGEFILTFQHIKNEAQYVFYPRILDYDMYIRATLRNLVDFNENGDPEYNQAILTIEVNSTYEERLIEQVMIPKLDLKKMYFITFDFKGENTKVYLNNDFINTRASLICEYESNYITEGFGGYYQEASTENLSEGALAPEKSVEYGKTNSYKTFINLKEDENGEFIEMACVDGESTVIDTTIDIKKSFKSFIIAKKEVLAFKEYQYAGTEEKDLFVSFKMKGKAHVFYEVYDGSTLIKSMYKGFYESIDWTEIHAIEEKAKKIVVYILTTDTVSFRDVQIEEKGFSQYISPLEKEGIVEDSLITFPSKDNIRSNTGTLSMYVKYTDIYEVPADIKIMLFEASENFQLYYLNDSFVFKYGTEEVAYLSEIPVDDYVNITASWKDSAIRIGINDSFEEKKKEVNVLASIDSTLKIGCSSIEGNELWQGSIDELVITTDYLSEKEFAEYQENKDLSKRTSTILNATFNYAIGGYDSSIIETTPIPNYGSPILVEKEDGTAMRKVSFFDFVTGEYRNYNEEDVVYKRIPYSVIEESNGDYEDKRPDYIEISYKAEDLELDSFSLKIMGPQGEVVGEPYEAVGNRIYFTLSPEEKTSYEGKTLTVLYQLKNSYTVDFNIGVADSFRISLGKHDGQSYKVYYEGNRFSDEKLLKMIELNPILSMNTEGFLYITKNVEKVTSFRAKSSETFIPANGGTKTLITIEPLDKYGNFISHANLEVSCEKGKIYSLISPLSYKAKETNGSYMYEYTAPSIYAKDVNKIQVEDVINYFDKETGIGSELKITLLTLREEEYLITKQDSLEDIALKTGVSIEEIAALNGMTVAEAQLYIIRNRNTNIKIPINYSAKELAQSLVEANQTERIVYLASWIYPRMNKLAETILDKKLDLLKDGKIDLNDIVYLIENKESEEILNLYTEFKQIENK